jgi:M6 family metalloprotease-like protein
LLVLFLAWIFLPFPGLAPATAGVAAPVNITGPQRLLIVAVRFPGIRPALDLAEIQAKVERVRRYVEESAYGKMKLETDRVGWYELPASLGEYAVSPYNFKVDRTRVRRLLADALSAASRETDLEKYRVVWIVVGVRTTPGEGYGMIAYAANPGMLSGVRFGKVRMETIELQGRRPFSGAVIVSADNAHVGHAAHDLLHALGGVQDGLRAVPDLYDYDRQSDPGILHDSPAPFAIHTGPWDIMSQHFIARDKAPPPPSSFTRLQLGWIDAGQVVTIARGDTREITLRPLASGGSPLVVRVPLGPQRFLLVENRQKIRGDAVLPASGMLVFEVDLSREEGSAIVKVVSANPGPNERDRAPFVPGAGARRYFHTEEAGVVIAPLAMEASGALRLVVTVPDRLPEFLGAGAQKGRDND